jgi:hypothetical protein
MYEFDEREGMKENKKGRKEKKERKTEIKKKTKIRDAKEEKKNGVENWQNRIRRK